MRNLNRQTIDQYRSRDQAVLEMFGTYGNDKNGVFNVPTPKSQWMLKVLASTGMGWEHVSVSLPDRCPIWAEMSMIKDMFFYEDEAVMQLHPPKKDYVNHHPFTLHLWKPLHAMIPLPDPIMVGPRNDTG